MGIFREGFDAYSGAGTVTGLASKWQVSGSPSIQPGSFGGQCVRLISSTTYITSPAWDSAVSTFNFNFGFRVATLGGSAFSHILFYSGTTPMFGIRFASDNSIIAYRQTAQQSGVTSLGASSLGVWAVNTWYTGEIVATVSDTVGAIQVKLDGTTVLNLTNVDTRNGTPTTIDRVLFQGTGNSNNFDVDDVYVVNSGSFLSKAVRIETLVPNGDGATLNWTPSTGVNHYAVVDELPVSTTDYLSATNVGDVDELNFSNLSSTPAAIEEVNLFAHWAKTDATARTAYLSLTSGGTTSDGSAFALNSTGVRNDRPLETDPNTSTAWTASGVNALIGRPKVAS